jgi:nucleoside-diphosphate-sugar epimerase
VSTSFNNILVVGCGYVGHAFATKLKSEGKQIWGLKRSGQGVNRNYPLFEANVLEPETLGVVPAEVENLVYAVSPSGASEQQYRDAYITGLKNISEHLKRYSSCRRVLLTSSTGIYEVSDGTWVDEETELVLDTWKSKILHTAEQQLASIWDDSSAIRFGGIYGPERTRMISMVSRADLDFDDDFPVYTNRMHRDDCAGVLEHLLEIKHLEKIYIGVDSDPAPRAELYQWISKELGLTLPTPNKWSQSKRLELGQGKRCSNRRLIDSGFTLEYPSFREGYLAQLAAFRTIP